MRSATFSIQTKQDPHTILAYSMKLYEFLFILEFSSYFFRITILKLFSNVEKIYILWCILE